jgi:hypothetical protein
MRHRQQQARHKPSQGAVMVILDDPDISSYETSTGIFIKWTNWINLEPE